MSHPLTTGHDHQPVFRVVAHGARDALEPSAAARHAWNTAEFPALYCCCSEWVARAVARETFRVAGVDLSDLQPEARPQLVEISWTGQVVDLVSREGIDAAGFPPEFPGGVTPDQTRRSSANWRSNGFEGVVTRSPALQKRGFTGWQGQHQRWGELVIFLDNARRPPTFIRRREDLEWL